MPITLTPEALVALRGHLEAAMGVRYSNGTPVGEARQLGVCLLATSSDAAEPALEVRVRLVGEVVDLCRIPGERMGLGWDQLGERFEIDLRDSGLFPIM